MSFVIGTVRSRRGPDHLVVTRTGEHLEVRFKGEPPLIGADIIGLTTVVDDRLTMTIVDDIVQSLLMGRALISASGRPDVTARMLASILSEAGPGCVAPGTGGIIERTPTMADPDAGWAFDILADEARASGIALNVVAPLTVAEMEWSDENLVNDLLPADATGERDALTDLRTIFLSGMNPTCRRTISRLGRGNATPSVDFIVPYSPFTTGVGFSSILSRARRDEMVKIPLSVSSSRRISSLREMTLAFSPRYLGTRRASNPFFDMQEQVFADVAATMFLLARGDEKDRQGANTLMPIREAGLSRWNGSGGLPTPSHKAIGEALRPGVSRPDAKTSDILRDAADIARSFTPSNETQLKETARQASGDFFFSRASMTDRRRKALDEHYVTDLKDAIGRLSSAAALDRFDRFASMDIPKGLDETYHEVLAPTRSRFTDEATFADEGMMFGEDPWIDAPMTP